MTENLENKIENPSPEDAPQPGAESKGEDISSSEKMVPASDVDKIKSSLDRAHAAELKAREAKIAELEAQTAKLEAERNMMKTRATTAEEKALEAQGQVNLRNRARQIAASFASSWGPDIAKAAEEKLLKAENDQHLQALYYEFLHADLPNLLYEEDETAVEEERIERAKTGVESIGSHALTPAETQKRLSDIDQELAELRSPDYAAKHPRVNRWLRIQELQRKKARLGEVGESRRTKV